MNLKKLPIHQKLFISVSAFVENFSYFVQRVFFIFYDYQRLFHHTKLAGSSFLLICWYQCSDTLGNCERYILLLQLPDILLPLLNLYIYSYVYSTYIYILLPILHLYILLPILHLYIYTPTCTPPIYIYSYLISTYIYIPPVLLLYIYSFPYSTYIYTSTCTPSIFTTTCTPPIYILLPVLHLYIYILLRVLHLYIYTPTCTPPIYIYSFPYSTYIYSYLYSTYINHLYTPPL